MAVTRERKVFLAKKHTKQQHSKWRKKETKRRADKHLNRNGGQCRLISLQEEWRRLLSWNYLREDDGTKAKLLLGDLIKRRYRE